MTDSTSGGSRLRRRLPLDWLGAVPFLIFALMFLILPTLYLIVGAFQNNQGEFTLENIVRLSEPSIRSAYWISIRISLASAVLGGLIGLAIATPLGVVITKASGGYLPLAVDAKVWLTGAIAVVVLSLAVGLLPALRAKRLTIVDALAGR